MTLSSYSDVFSISHERDYEEEIHKGDIVRTGPNAYPHFMVVAVSGDRAWVRNVVSGVDSLAFVARCRRIEAPAIAMAAE